MRANLCNTAAQGNRLRKPHEDNPSLLNISRSCGKLRRDTFLACVKQGEATEDRITKTSIEYKLLNHHPPRRSLNAKTKYSSSSVCVVSARVQEIETKRKVWRKSESLMTSQRNHRNSQTWLEILQVDIYRSDFIFRWIMFEGDGHINLRRRRSEEILPLSVVPLCFSRQIIWSGLVLFGKVYVLRIFREHLAWCSHSPVLMTWWKITFRIAAPIPKCKHIIYSSIYFLI